MASRYKTDAYIELQLSYLGRASTQSKTCDDLERSHNSGNPCPASTEEERAMIGPLKQH